MLKTSFDDNKGLFSASLAALKRTPQAGSMLLAAALVGLVPILGTLIASAIIMVWAQAALTRDLAEGEKIDFSFRVVGLAFVVNIISMIISLCISWGVNAFAGNFQFFSNIITILGFFISIMLNALCIHAILKGKISAFFSSRIFLLVREDWTSFFMVALLEFIFTVVFIIAGAFITGVALCTIPFQLVPGFDFFSLAQDVNQGVFTQQVFAVIVAGLIAWLFVSLLVTGMFFLSISVTAAWIARTDSPEICFACYSEEERELDSLPEHSEPDK